MSLHYRRPAGFGVNGAGDGRNGGVWIWPPDGETPARPTTGDGAYADSVPLAGLLDQLALDQALARLEAEIEDRLPQHIEHLLAQRRGHPADPQ